jgi:hypothetical protein
MIKTYIFVNLTRFPAKKLPFISKIRSYEFETLAAKTDILIAADKDCRSTLAITADKGAEVFENYAALIFHSNKMVDLQNKRVVAL